MEELQLNLPTDLKEIYVELALSLQGFSEDIKAAANLIPFTYLKQQDAIKRKQMTKEQAAKEMEEVASGIRIDTSPPLDEKA